ncbi:MAG: hypothetical protein LBG83_02800 [Oscillospiraceae bacterium]|jgi:hypothetical protein|nr:hypothetical protein [Oscillospiraceae bacterium]
MKQRLKQFVAERQVRVLKPYVLPFAILLSLVVLLGTTLAWFTASDNMLNPMKNPPKGNFGVDLVDVFTPPEPNDPPLEPGVGNSVDKRVGAYNTQTVDAFVRLLVIPVFVTSDGTLLPAEFGKEVIIVSENTTDWAYCAYDGYYYYKDILPAGKSTDVGSLNKNLFNKVYVAAGLPDEYDGATLKIEVKCEAVDTVRYHYREGWWALPPLNGANAPYNALSEYTADGYTIDSVWAAIDGLLKPKTKA